MKTNTKPMPNINMGFEAVAGNNVKPKNKQEFQKKLESIVSSNKVENKPAKKPVNSTASKDQEKIVEILKEKLEPLEIPEEKVQSVMDFMLYLLTSAQETQKIEQEFAQLGLKNELLDSIKNIVSDATSAQISLGNIMGLAGVSKPVISDYREMIAQQGILKNANSETSTGSIVLPQELEHIENAQVLNFNALSQVGTVPTNAAVQSVQVVANENSANATPVVNTQQETTNDTAFTLKVTQSTLSEQSDSQTDLGSQMQGQHNPEIQIKDFTKLTVANAQMDGRAEFISQQVATAVKTAILGDKMEFTMQLQPHELGKLIVKMVMEGGKLSVSIAAQNAETQKLLASQLTNLEQTLKTDSIKIQAFELQNESFNDMASFGQDLSQQNQKTFKDSNHAKQSANKFSLDAQEQEEDLSTTPVKTFDSSRVNISV